MVAIPVWCENSTRPTLFDIMKTTPITLWVNGEMVLLLFVVDNSASRW